MCIRYIVKPGVSRVDQRFQQNIDPNTMFGSRHDIFLGFGSVRHIQSNYVLRIAVLIETM